MPEITLPATPLPIASTPTERPPGASRLHFDHGYPASVKRDDIQRLLQGMVTASYGTGFKHLGDAADFFHGHIIFGPKPWQGGPPARSAAMAAHRPDSWYNWEPIGVLYHTQEHAFDAERVAAPNHRYVDRMRRNWLQLWDGRIVDIANYLRPNEKMNDHFTFFDFQLDGARLGARTVPVHTGQGVHEGLWGTFQFQFSRIEAGAFDAARDDMIMVSLPSAEPRGEKPLPQSA